MPKTNKIGPNTRWVPKDKIVSLVDMLDDLKETIVMVLGQWLLTAYDGERSMFQSLRNKKGGSMTFKGNQRGKIIGVERIGINVSPSIDNVLLVDGLKHNFLSISQFL